MHHVAYQTDDIDAALERVRAAGLRLIDEEPRKGIRGSRVAFLHPNATGGVLTEIVEPAEATDGRRARTRSTSASRAAGARRLRVAEDAFDGAAQGARGRQAAGTTSRPSDSTVTLDLSQVVYLRVETGPEVGF